MLDFNKYETVALSLKRGKRRIQSSIVSSKKAKLSNEVTTAEHSESSSDDGESCDSDYEVVDPPSSSLARPGENNGQFLEITPRSKKDSFYTANMSFGSINRYNDKI